MPRRFSEVFPTWIWFFLALPLGVLFFYFWQRRQKLTLARLPLPVIRRMRYIEPDSIPIDTRPAYDMSEMEEAYDTDHVFEMSAAALAKETSRMHSVSFESAVAPNADDLKKIEGIGPKIAGLLNENGITTFQQLAVTPLERLDELLIGAKLRRIADPGTWPEQAQLAAAGDWDALRELQGTLKGGKRKA